MKIKILKNLYRSVAFSLLLFPFAFTYAFFVNVSDTSAGEEASFQISGLTANEGVQATLKRPEGNEVNLSFQADEQGRVQSEIYGLHLKKSGDYTLAVSRLQSDRLRESQVFTVVPGVASRFRSEISTTVPTLPADGVALAPLKIQVRDAYGNPVPGQSVQVFSSRNEDVINVAGKTDANGLVTGTVFSTSPGISIISAMVEGDLLFERSEIIFHLPSSSGGAVGQSGIGQFLKAQLFTDDFEEVAYLSIEGLPSEVLTEEGYTFRVAAKDTNGNVVKNYEGQVRFSSNDSGGQFPVDYTFTRTDQGEHEFAVAAAFATPGTRTLTVTDLEDSSIQGQVEVNVVSKNQVVEPPVDDALVIVTPNEGTFSSPRMTITGRGEPGAQIKITDGPTVLVEDLSLDINGDFFYQTPALADGRHVFRAELMDGSLVSNVVEIRIDNTPPRVLAVEVDPPDGVGAGGVFRVTVSSNEPLSTATCSFKGEATPLNRSGDVFVGDINAGEECGTFPLGCTVSDVLGNELQENQAATVQVCGNEPAPPEPVVPEPTPPEPPEEPTNLPPTAVSSLNATPGEKRITLYWSPAKDDKAISQYKVEFGENPDALTDINITPDNRTQWYVDRLKVGTKYFFRVTAIDNDGEEGVSSNLVEATTFGEIYQSAAVPQSGSSDNIWLPLLLSFFGGILFILFGRRKA